MNKAQLPKMVGRELRLRPPIVRESPEFRRIASEDDKWLLATYEPKPPTVSLRNVRTGEGLQIQLDNVREFRSPDFLLLRCQVYLGSLDGTRIEPLVGQSPPVPIARYQAASRRSISMSIAYAPAVCEGCTSLVRFRPTFRITLSGDGGGEPISQTFCPRCAYARGVNVSAVSRWPEDTLMALANPTYRDHVYGILGDVVVDRLRVDQDLKAAGMTDIIVGHSGPHLFIIPEAVPWRPRAFIPLALWESEGRFSPEAIQAAAKGLVMTLLDSQGSAVQPGDHTGA